MKWADPVGYEGIYSVSERGDVYSYRLKREMRQSSHKSGHLVIGTSPIDGLPKSQAYVHRLVALAFIPNPEELPLVRHYDDDPTNNQVENLRWGTYGDNANDAVRNGRNKFANQTHCLNGHAYSEGDHRVRANSKRLCQKCEREWRARDRIWKSENTPFDDIPHGTGGYSNYLCRCAVCKSAKAEYARNRKRKRAQVEKVT